MPRRACFAARSAGQGAAGQWITRCRGAGAAEGHIEQLNVTGTRGSARQRTRRVTGAPWDDPQGQANTEENALKTHGLHLPASRSFICPVTIMFRLQSAICRQQWALCGPAGRPQRQTVPEQAHLWGPDSV